MSVAIIPYDGNDPLKYLYLTVSQWKKHGFDVVIVDTSFHIYPPYVKRIKQRSPGISGARYDGFKYALEKGYDCIINSDSHVILAGNPHTLCKTRTFASAPHHPWEDIPFTITLPVRIYASIVFPEHDKIIWCSIFSNPKYIPMTSEPLYAINAKALEEVLDKVTKFKSYGLDNTWLYYVTLNRGPGEIKDGFYYYHLGIFTRLKPPNRKPDNEEAYRFIQTMHWVKDLLHDVLKQQRLCHTLWSPQQHSESQQQRHKENS